MPWRYRVRISPYKDLIAFIQARRGANTQIRWPPGVRGKIEELVAVIPNQMPALARQQLEDTFGVISVTEEQI